MARPKSEDKKQALLEAATAAFAQSGIAASTALIARNAGVAEGTLFRYFATKDDLLNALYLHLKQDLCQTMLANLDRTITEPKEHTRNIWNSYVDWGIRNPLAHAAIRQIGVSEKLNAETEQAVKDMFPELHELCRRSIRPVFMSDEFKTFGDAMFLSLAETTMEFAARDPSRAVDFKALLNQQIYRGVEPGYHLNKKHWISLYGTDDITPELVSDLITDSWNLVVDKLPKKDQKWIRPA
ncbi:TetR family transcriptional regulator [Enterobacter hormaechei]|uniref:TetR family transcriptional regulator n=1 Tax=Enterobacter hormaechei TaxID=158836 RepID=UPI002FF04650